MLFSLSYDMIANVDLNVKRKRYKNTIYIGIISSQQSIIDNNQHKMSILVKLDRLFTLITTHASHKIKNNNDNLFLIKHYKTTY